MKKKYVAWIILVIVFVAGYFVIFRKKTPAQKLATLESQVASKGGRIFEAKIHDTPLAFLLQDCAVYLLAASGGGVKRTKVLDAGFYLGFTVCSRESIQADQDYVKVTLGKQAIGAGGCCAVGGNYRSKNGLVWEKDGAKGWRPLDEAQP